MWLATRCYTAHYVFPVHGITMLLDVVKVFCDVLQVVFYLLSAVYVHFTSCFFDEQTECCKFSDSKLVVYFSEHKKILLATRAKKLIMQWL